MEKKPCGLIAMVPPSLQNEWAEQMAELVHRFQPAALIFGDPLPDVLEKALASARMFELAILLADGTGAAAASGAAGVYLTSSGPKVAQARGTLGDTAIIGAACGLSRHEAMMGAEAGADFVVFDASNPAAWDDAVEIASWWDELTGVPAALDFGRTRPDLNVILKARPDFLLLQETECAGESLTFATEFGLQSQS